MPINVAVPATLSCNIGSFPLLDMVAGSAQRGRLLDESGGPREHMDVFMGSTNVRGLEGFQTPLNDRDEVTILPAVSGG